MSAPAVKLATYADIEALPPNLVGEIVKGVLYAQPRPRMAHTRSSSRLGMQLGARFDLGEGGPGGWVILDEPELHLREDVLVPDLAGWRRESLGGELPLVAAMSLAPDWIAEVVSPGTAALDRGAKLDVYARERVPWVWLIDPEAKLLEVFEWVEERYRRRSAHADSAVVRVPPFDAIEFDVGILWAR